MMRPLSLRWLIPFALLVLLLPGCDDSSSDVDTVEQLVDAHNLAWVDNDPEGVGATYADSGAFVNTVGDEMVGREEIVAYAKFTVAAVVVRRTGPVEVHEDGTYLVPTEVVIMGRGTYLGDVVVTIEDDLLALYDCSEGLTHQ